jgi:hypothetical protein
VNSKQKNSKGASVDLIDQIPIGYAAQIAVVTGSIRSTPALSTSIPGAPSAAD